MNKKLDKLIQKARSHNMTERELMTQRVGFAYGNAPLSNANTKGTVSEAIKNARIAKSSN